MSIQASRVPRKLPLKSKTPWTKCVAVTHQARAARGVDLRGNRRPLGEWVPGCDGRSAQGSVVRSSAGDSRSSIPARSSPPPLRCTRALRRVRRGAAHRGRRSRRPDEGGSKRSSSPAGNAAPSTATRANPRFPPSDPVRDAGARTDNALFTPACSSPPSVAIRPRLAARSPSAALRCSCGAGPTCRPRYAIPRRLCHRRACAS
jgi:hypothetical protein